MARDVTLVAGPPEIHGEEVLKFAWIVLINLRGLLRSASYSVEPTPEGARKNGALFFERMFRRSKTDDDPLAWRTSGTPLFEANCHVDATNFYLAPLTGPATFAARATAPATVRDVLSVLERLTPDSYSTFLTTFCREGLQRFGEAWRYADINTVLLTVASMLPLRDYLEIGVRRGRSLAMIASQRPDIRIAGFDLWMEDYAGMPNPGPAFVREELARAGFRGELELISGDSHQTVPRFFREHPDRWFDAITVDGDHTLAGGRADLQTVIARLRIGGVLIFDDVCSQFHPYLSDLWDETVADVTRWASWRFDDAGFGVGFAIRKR